MCVTRITKYYYLVIGADAANGLRSVDVPFANFGLAGTVAVTGLIGGLE